MADVSPAQNSVISVSANSFIMTFCVTLEQHACVARMSLRVSYQGPAVVYIASRPGYDSDVSLQHRDEMCRCLGWLR